VNSHTSFATSSALFSACWALVLSSIASPSASRSSCRSSSSFRHLASASCESDCSRLFSLSSSSMRCACFLWISCAPSPGLRGGIEDVALGDVGPEAFRNDSDLNFDCMDMEGCLVWESLELSSGILGSCGAASSFSTASSGSTLVDVSASGSVFSSFFFAGPFLAFCFFNCSYWISG
jgi:hypothetical protein